MGIYTDYGRFMKARQFKEWCNSGAGIWFGFGIGSPRWDDSVPDAEDKIHLCVPPSAPTAYTSVYRWFRRFKGIEDDNYDPSVLSESEMALLDRSYSSERWGWQDNEDIEDEYQRDNVSSLPAVPPSDDLKPSVSIYNSTSPNDKVESHLWDDSQSHFSDRYYPSPFIPPFPVSYKKDWEDALSMSDDPDLKPEHSGGPVLPSDPERYLEYSYMKHIYEGMQNDTPLGLLSFIRGEALFVKPIKDGEESSTLHTFKYGTNYWKVMSDSDISKFDLPHHVLLTVNVFPGELDPDYVVEKYLSVRQVSVYKFPDSLTPSSDVSRSSQVILRNRINMKYNSTDPDKEGYINIPFLCDDPLDPSGTIEMLINDFMTARKRDVQQTDRYGYIIGF